MQGSDSSFYVRVGSTIYVSVKKKDGMARLCQHCRKLNTPMKTQSGGLGDLPSIFDKLHASKFFTTVDLAPGYFQIDIAQKDKKEDGLP